MPFNTTFFGYDRKQVDAAIDKLTADAMESAQRAERLTAELERQRQAADALRHDHEQLSHALVSAHKAATEIREAADLNAKEIVMDAQLRADAMLRDAEQALKGIERQIDALVKQRRDAEEAYGAFINSMVKAYENRRATDNPSSLTKIS
jgi:cell division septum initiation protein DivIVA